MSLKTTVAPCALLLATFAALSPNEGRGLGSRPRSVR